MERLGSKFHQRINDIEMYKLIKGIRSGSPPVKDGKVTFDKPTVEKSLKDNAIKAATPAKKSVDVKGLELIKLKFTPKVTPKKPPTTGKPPKTGIHLKLEPPQAGSPPATGNPPQTGKPPATEPSFAASSSTTTGE